jgi:hypothetical protein
MNVINGTLWFAYGMVSAGILCRSIWPLWTSHSSVPDNLLISCYCKRRVHVSRLKM